MWQVDKKDKEIKLQLVIMYTLERMQNFRIVILRVLHMLEWGHLLAKELQLRALLL